MPKGDEAERAIAMISSDDTLAVEMAGALVEWKKVLDMLKRERDHLTDEINRKGSRRSLPWASSSPRMVR